MAFYLLSAKSFDGNYLEVAGFGGYIFNINNIRNIKHFYNKMPLCCRHIDDNWISWCINKLGISVIHTIETNAWNNVLDIKNTDPHPDWFELCKNTNRNELIKEMFSILK